MGNSEPKNTKKYTVIITYTLAVVFLLLGLLLPMFYDKGVQGMLVMQLPKAFDIICGGKGAINLGNDFVASHVVHLFGIEKAAVDVTAWAVVLYAVITLFALLAFIPMGVTFKKCGKFTRICAYVIEIAAALALSVYAIVALEYAQYGEAAFPPFNKHAINIWVALGGTLLMLIIQCCINKKSRSAAVKVSQFVLSAVALCSLFAFYLLTPKFSELWINTADKLKCSPDLFGAVLSLTGMDHVDMVFTDNFFAQLKELGTVTDKTVITLGAIVGVLTVLNFFIDIIGLASNAKRKGFIFNCVRYGLTFLAAICLFITIAVAKYAQGLALALLFVIVAIELAINLGIILTAVVKHKQREAKRKAATSEQPLEYGVNDYANLERTPKQTAKEARAAAKAEKAAKKAAAAQQPVPDYSDNPAPNPYVNPYANPYAQPFGSDQPSYLNPFGDAGLRNGNVAQPEPEQPVQEKPAPAYDPTVGYPPDYLKSQEYKPPVQEYNPVQDYRNYQPVQDYQPAKQPVTEEPKPSEPTVHNVYSTYPPAPQTQQETPDRVYRVNTVYQGPTDEFLRKLTNDEKIEFAMIFIERSKGEIGRVPEYAIGGDNKKFFSSVFIYLGRIRGIISDGLLNKMYKEINMFR